MSTTLEVVARAIAHERRRVYPIRETFSLAPDPTPAFGIAPIKVVSEEVIQAIAFGDIKRPPRVIVRWNPLSRDAGELEPFANALNRYLSSSVAAGVLPRIWLPYPTALDLIDVLHFRYRTNKNASTVLQRMGWQCRVIAEEAGYAGQQMVAIATNLLCEHLVTGQAPVKDRHLGALLAWVTPPVGIDPVVEAERRALIPAAAMLEAEADRRVDALRKKAKAGDARAKGEIESLLERGARFEWQRLSDGRKAFWALGFPQGSEVAELVKESLERVRYALSVDLSPPSRPDALARLLDEHEYSAELREDADLRGDVRIRERERLMGKVIRATVTRIIQPKPSRKPCRIVLRTNQEVLRVRRGTYLGTLNGKVGGRVVEERDSPTGRDITLSLEKGVRRSVLPAVGSSEEWIDSAPYNGRFQMNRVRAILQAAAPPLGYSDQLPAPAPRRIRGDLGEVAARLRRSG